MSTSDLLQVEDALSRILAKITPLSSETIPLDHALHRTLAQDVSATENLPPFPASAVDGFGVVVEDVQTATQQTPRTLQVSMEVQAGHYTTQTLQTGHAVRIMTGAPVPEGVTAIVPIENTNANWQEDNDHVLIYTSANPGDNIRPVGENVREGQPLFKAGHSLRPQDIGLMAALGMAHISVIKSPHVVVLSTGDELLDVDQLIQPGKIRDSNSHIIAGLVTSYGGRVTRLPIVRDTPQDVRTAFDQAIAHQPDMIISSGGVSVGAADYIRPVLEEMGQVNFWKINFRPGKPLAFGQLRGVPFFGLPGNPVSVFVTFEVMVRPALLRQMHKPDVISTQTAILKESVNSDGRLSYLRVKLEVNNGVLYATTTGTQSSGALFSLVIADGLLILPEGLTHAQAGQVFPVRLLKEIT